MADTHPSTAHLDSRGNYVHDPLNQHYAEMEKQGKLAPQDRGQQKHPFGKPGYCEAHKALGCTECA